MVRLFSSFFRFCPKNPPEAMRSPPHRFRIWVSSRKPHCRASAEGPSAMLSTHTPCRQSWRGHRIAPLNPGVGTGLPHSILAWAQDCPTQSWRGHRIAPVFPRKRWKRSAAQHYAPRLAARIARKTPSVRRYTPMH